MVINTNIAAQNASNMLASSSANLAKSLQRLSSGSKITSPEDDAAGLAVSMRLGAQSNRISATENNLSNAVSFTQTQDGFMQQVSKALDRMSELAVSSQDVTKTSTDTALYQKEFAQLGSYINDVVTKDFNGVSLFAAGATSSAVTIDSNGGTWSMSGIDLGSSTSAATAASVATSTAAASALTLVKTAIDTLAGNRADVGASMTRLSYTNEQLAVQKTNLDAANSRIKDVDVAQESTNYAKLNILVQSGTAMLAQANTMPQSVLRLLQ